MVARSLAVLALVGAIVPSAIASLETNVQYPFQPGGPTSAPRDTYAGQRVWRLEWADSSDALREQFMESLHALSILDVDVWKATPRFVDFRIHESSLATVQRFLPPDTASYTLTPFIPDLQSLVDETAAPSASSGSGEWNLSTIDDPFHDAYHSLEEINAFGDALVAKFNGVQNISVEGFSVGETYEGRQIRGWKAFIANDTAEELKKKKGKKGKKGPKEDIEREFVVQSGQHAREWVGPATALYWFHSLLLAAVDDPESDATNLLNSFTFTIIPTINPDGYAYSRDHSRLWRKNRQDTGSSICTGIDLNTNWGYKWRQSKASQCSDAYGGKAAFEAYETRAMSEYLMNGTTVGAAEGTRKRKVRAFIDLHSYGQLFMFPFAHSCDDFPPDAEMLMEAGLGVAKAMRSGHGEAYQAGQACELTYRAPGDAIDYAYGEVDARWSYSAELRDTGTYGFMLPPSLIRPAAEEANAGLHYLAKFIYTLEIAP